MLTSCFPTNFSPIYVETFTLPSSLPSTLVLFCFFPSSVRTVAAVPIDLQSHIIVRGAGQVQFTQ